ncbi:hypothetical protein [Rhodococcoides kyotonense]|nr:hypothetical protein [Rhodococcus kyotonensis]
MTEPFLPRHRHDDSIDAADPGIDAPSEDDVDRKVEAFEERLDSERDEKTLFRTPKPE